MGSILEMLPAAPTTHRNAHRRLCSSRTNMYRLSTLDYIMFYRIDFRAQSGQWHYGVFVQENEHL